MKMLPLYSPLSNTVSNYFLSTEDAIEDARHAKIKTFKTPSTVMP
jgi:hypothetical protein